MVQQAHGVPLPGQSCPLSRVGEWGFEKVLVRRQGLQDSALGDRAVAALPDKGGELTAEGAEVGELAVHLGNMLPRDGVHRLAGPFPLVGEAEKDADLLEGEAEVAGTPGEAQPRELPRPVAPVAPGRAGRGR